MATIKTLLDAYLNTTADPWQPDQVAGLALADLLGEQGNRWAETVRDLASTPVTLNRTSRRWQHPQWVYRRILATGQTWWAYFDSSHHSGLIGQVDVDGLNRKTWRAMRTIWERFCDPGKDQTTDPFFAVRLAAPDRHLLNAALPRAVQLLACQVVAALLDPNTDPRVTMALPTISVQRACASHEVCESPLLTAHE